MNFESYKLICHGCGETVALPAGDPNKTEALACPMCQSELVIQWRPVVACERRAA